MVWVQASCSNCSWVDVDSSHDAGLVCDGRLVCDGGLECDCDDWFVCRMCFCHHRHGKKRVVLVMS